VSDTLREEIAFHDQHKMDWIADGHGGEYAVIQGDILAGFFAEFEDAFRAGLERFGVDKPFLVRKVLKEAEVFLIF
jgi:hypothetical protein